MPPKVVVTRRIPSAGLEMLKQHCEVEINPEARPMTPEELKKNGSDADALVTMLYDRVDEDLLQACPHLKVISNFAVGIDNIDVEACNRHKVMVANTPGVLTEATADLSWALMLSVSRRIVEGDRFVREGKFNGWDSLLFIGGEFHRKVLGVIGMGRIGQAVARRAKGFQMKVLYYQRHRLERKLEKELNATYLPLEDVLRMSDYVTLHIPLTDASYHLLDKKRLQLLKSGAYLINTARGPIVDQAALVDMLKEKRIAGAGFDVYENEPQLTPGLDQLDNVVLAPHLGSANKATRDSMARTVAENILAGLKGEAPPNFVNPEVLQK